MHLCCCFQCVKFLARKSGCVNFLTNLKSVSVMWPAPLWQNLKKIKTHLPGNLSLRNIAPSNNPAAKSSFIGFNLSGNPTIWRENHLQSRQDMILQRKMSSSKKSTHSNYHQCPISHLSRFSVHHLLWMADWILAQPSTFSITDHK